MALLKITLTEDMLKLISNIRFKEYIPVEEDTEEHKVSYEIDLNSLYGGNFVFEDIARILDFYDKRIENTEDEPMGPRFPQELEDYMWEIHCYILDNLEYIEQIVHQFVTKGGIKEGTYTTKHNQLIWKYKE